MRKKFLAIGLGRAALHEALTAASKRIAKQLLRSIPMNDWQCLPVEQAALFAADLTECLLERHWGDDDDSGAEDGEESLNTIEKQLLNSLMRRQTLQGLVPMQSAREIIESILKLGRRSQLPIRAFWHFVLHSWLQDSKQPTPDGGVFDASAAVAAWKKLDEERFSFSSSKEISAEEKAARKKAYLDHLSAAMVDGREREEWDFLFKED